MGKIIAFISGKGGAGKTVTVANLGAKMAKYNGEVLLVDCDFSTRGLTFFVIGEKSCQVGFLNYLQELSWKEDSSSEELETNTHARRILSNVERDIMDYERLSLLPASGSTELYSLKDFEIIVSQARDIHDWKAIYSKIRELFLLLAEHFDYILVDTRSGSDPVSLLPAVASDEFVLMIEEDKTSWRIGGRLIAVMTQLIDSLEPERAPKLVFKGFILNKVTEEIPHRFLSSYLEKRVIGGLCLHQIPLEKDVPLAFKEDKLIVDESPSSSFSNKMAKLAENILGYVVKEKRKIEIKDALIGIYGSPDFLFLLISAIMVITVIATLPVMGPLAGLYLGFATLTFAFAVGSFFVRLFNKFRRK